MLALRHREKDLQADAPFRAVCTEPDKPFVYRRGELTLALNPSGRALSVTLPFDVSRTLYQIGEAEAAGRRLTVMPQSFIALR